MRNQEWDPALAELHLLDLAELELSLLSLDAVDGEATLGVVDETEVLAGLLDTDDVHETGRVGRVSADLAVDLDETLHQDRLGLTAVKGVLQTIKEDSNQFSVPILLISSCDGFFFFFFFGFVPVADEDDQRQAVPELVRTRGGLGSIDSGHFVQEPVRGRTQALLVLLTIERIGLASSSHHQWLNHQSKEKMVRQRRDEARNNMDQCKTYGPRGILAALST